MKINVYDFDGTIYDGDSSKDFYKFCLSKKKKCLLILPKFTVNYFLYFIKLKSKTKVKESYFSFLKYFDNTDKLLDEFWEEYDKKIKKFYLEKNHKNDVIVSASPTFLLEKICKKLKVKDLIASEVDVKTGKFIGVNCKGKEKINRLNKKYKEFEIMETYTDSESDRPLIDLAQKAYMVKKNEIKCIK